MISIQDFNYLFCVLIPSDACCVGGIDIAFEEYLNRTSTNSPGFSGKVPNLHINNLYYSKFCAILQILEAW